jgi:hypothetical protein
MTDNSSSDGHNNPDVEIPGHAKAWREAASKDAPDVKVVYDRFMKLWNKPKNKYCNDECKPKFRPKFRQPGTYMKFQEDYFR